eukprot:m.63818 g.63818  ORF g.63818 m.63818 type:complete len:117 (-) comp17815_c0_seq3:3802-4152(-)
MAQADEVDEERLKSAVGYTVGLIVKDFEEKSEGPTFSKRTISLLGDLVYRQTETAAVDLQLFARHAKRTTVTMEDVKLISRRSDTIHDHVSEVGDMLATATKQNRKGKKAAAPPDT